MEIWKKIGSSAVHLTAKVQPFTVSSFCTIPWWWWVCGVRDLGTISASMGDQKSTMSMNSHSWPADATATGAAFPPGAAACTAHWGGTLPGECTHCSLNASTTLAFMAIWAPPATRSSEARLAVLAFHAAHLAACALLWDLHVPCSGLLRAYH